MLHDYQKACVAHVLNKPYCGLFLDMGLGKTAVTLTAITELFMRFEISKVLIIAPKKVAESTWQSEMAKWPEFHCLTCSTVMGTGKQRLEALEAKANIYITNRDNVTWLAGVYEKKKWPFDMVVLDESTSFKSHSSQRFKAIKRMKKFISRLVLLTGTPSPNGLEDLWSQIYLLDGGERLGPTFGAFRTRYFNELYRVNGMFAKYGPKPGAADAVADKISDLCISMKAEDYLKMPSIIYDDRLVKLDDDARKAYETLERDMLLKTDENTIEAMSATALMNKLLQLANGAVYDETRKYSVIHYCKLEALKEMVESLNGEPVLVFYSYIHDCARIMTAIPEARLYKDSKDLDEWNGGNIRVLLAHPASTAYGLNMQRGGHHIIWFGLTWNYELYEQANARLHRQGQTKPVIVHHLLVENSRDIDVKNALAHKDEAQNFIIARLKAEVRRAKNEI